MSKPKIKQKDKAFSKFYHEVIDGNYWCQLSGVACKVYCVLLRNVDIYSRSCVMTCGRIAIQAGISLDSVTKAIRELVRMHLIGVSKGNEKIRFGYVFTVYTAEKIKWEWEHHISEEEQKKVLERAKRLDEKAGKVRKYYDNKQKDIQKEDEDSHPIPLMLPSPQKEDDLKVDKEWQERIERERLSLRIDG